MNFINFFNLVQHSLSSTFTEVDVWFEKPSTTREYRPKNGGWTIDEILEHISLTNHYLLILINKSKEKALKSPSDVDINIFQYDVETIQHLNEIGQHKSFEWIRPEHMEPTGSVSLSDVKNRLKEQVESCLNTLELLKNGEGLNAKMKMSVNDIGKIDVYQYIYFLSMHAKRHIEQMKRNEEEYNQLKK